MRFRIASSQAPSRITRANMIVGTTHNVAAMNLSVRDAASRLIRDGACDEAIRNRIEMALRAYDP